MNEDWMTLGERESWERMRSIGRAAMQLGIRDEEELAEMARFWHTSRGNAPLALGEVRKAKSALALAEIALRNLR